MIRLKDCESPVPSTLLSSLVPIFVSIEGLGDNIPLRPNLPDSQNTPLSIIGRSAWISKPHHSRQLFNHETWWRVDELDLDWIWESACLDDFVCGWRRLLLLSISFSPKMFLVVWVPISDRHDREAAFMDQKKLFLWFPSSRPFQKHTLPECKRKTQSCWHIWLIGFFFLEMLASSGTLPIPNVFIDVTTANSSNSALTENIMHVVARAITKSLTTTFKIIKLISRAVFHSHRRVTCPLQMTQTIFYHRGWVFLN